jgi:hypothetical protein
MLARCRAAAPFSRLTPSTGTLRLQADEFPDVHGRLLPGTCDLPAAGQVLEGERARVNLVRAQDGSHQYAKPVGVIELPGNAPGLAEPVRLESDGAHIAGAVDY